MSCSWSTKFWYCTLLYLFTLWILSFERVGQRVRQVSLFQQQRLYQWWISSTCHNRPIQLACHASTITTRLLAASTKSSQEWLLCCNFASKNISNLFTSLLFFVFCQSFDKIIKNVCMFLALKENQLYFVSCENYNKIYMYIFEKYWVVRTFIFFNLLNFSLQII